MLGYLYGKRFGSKIAHANSKEGEPVTLLAIGSGCILKPSHSSYVPTYEDETDSVLKRWHIKFRCLGITQKKAHNNIQIP